MPCFKDSTLNSRLKLRDARPVAVFRFRSMNKMWKNDWPLAKSSASSRVSGRFSPPVSGRHMVLAVAKSAMPQSIEKGMLGWTTLWNRAVVKQFSHKALSIIIDSQLHLPEHQWVQLQLLESSTDMVLQNPGSCKYVPLYLFKWMYSTYGVYDERRHKGGHHHHRTCNCH